MHLEKPLEAFLVQLLISLGAPLLGRPGTWTSCSSWATWPRTTWPLSRSGVRAAASTNICTCRRPSSRCSSWSTSPARRRRAWSEWGSLLCSGAPRRASSLCTAACSCALVEIFPMDSCLSSCLLSLTFALLYLFLQLAVLLQCSRWNPALSAEGRGFASRVTVTLQCLAHTDLTPCEMRAGCSVPQDSPRWIWKHFQLSELLQAHLSAFSPCSDVGSTEAAADAARAPSFCRSGPRFPVRQQKTGHG